MRPLGYVGHVTYSFINMLFISTGIFYDKLRPPILSVDTTAKAPLSHDELLKNILNIFMYYLLNLYAPCFVLHCILYMIMLLLHRKTLI
jgi:hypothetical protein